MSLASDFGLLFILEARDRASEILDKVDVSLDRLGGTAKATADAVKGAGAAIDESLLQTASGADALDLAAAQVEAAETRLAAATSAQAEAERALLAARDAAVSEEELAAAGTAVADAQAKAAAAEAEMTAAAAAQRDALASLAAGLGDGAAAVGIYVDEQGKLRDAQGRFLPGAEAQRAAQQALDDGLAEGTAAADSLAAASDRLAAAQKAAAGAAAEQSAAQAKADAMVSSQDVANASAQLTAAQKDTKAASDALTASQEKQAGVQRAAAAADTEAAAAAEKEAAAQKKAAQDAQAAQGFLGKATKTAGLISLGMGAAGYEAVKAAGNFQSATTHLVTDAGVAQKNLAMVQAGILKVSTATGTSATDVTNAMYHIASAGYTAQNGLNVLKVATEGAKVGGADLDTVSKTLVGTLTAYYGSQLSAGAATKDSTSLMNQLITTVSTGDMRMQDLASSLSSVTPMAAAAHLSFAQVGGAIATMTAQGMTADRATQDLNHLLTNIVHPTAAAANEMKALGVSASQVSQNLGKSGPGGGLTGTLNELTAAILRNSKGGMVSLGYYKEMTPAVQSLANGILAGKVTTYQLTQAMKTMTPQQAKVITQFKTAAVSATGLKQTYTAALAAMTGGQTSLDTSLMLTGTHMATLTANVNKISAAAKAGGSSVENWSKIQATFSQKMDMAKTAVENTGIAIGSAILPAVTSLLGAITKIVVPIAEWTAKHKTLTEILFLGVTAISATVFVLGTARKALKAVSGAVEEMKKVYKGLAGLFRKTAAGQAAAAQEGAAAQETAAKQSAAAQETAAAEGATAEETAAAESATANEEAAATSSGSWIAASGRMIASAVKWVGQSLLKIGQVVAANVTGALEAAAAWLGMSTLATAGLGLLVIGAAVAVFEIVKHWKAVSKAVAKVWDEVYGTVSKAVAAVISFVKSHWSLIVSVITGPLGIIVTQVISHWNDIKKWFSDGVHAVASALSWFTRLPGLFAGWIGGAVKQVTGEGQKILSWFSQLPGRVLSFLAKLGPGMLNVGKNAILGLVRGIESMFGSVGSVMSHLGHLVENTVKSVLGIASPSTVMAQAGLMVTAGLDQGMQKGTPSAVARGKSVAAVLLNSLNALSAARGGRMRTAGQGLPAGLAQGLADGSPKAITAAEQMAARTMAATVQLRDAKAGQMHAAGQGLVQGIWNGISASTSWLLSNITGFASNVLHGISSALGIGSPSRYTTEHGKMLGTGMANGMLASLPEILAAGRQMARAALSATAALAPAGGLGAAGQVSAAGLSGASLAALPAGSGAAGGGTNVYLTVTGNTVMSDADTDRLVTRIGQRLTTTILPSSGVRVYPRH